MSLEITNKSEFNTALQKILRDNENNAEKILKKVSFDGLRAFQRKTPKDTGRARAGWNTTVDERPSEWQPAKDKSHYPLTPFNGEGSITFTSLINISNNVEYILPLDHGHSKQAAQGIQNPVLSRMTVHLNKLISAESRRVVR